MQRRVKCLMCLCIAQISIERLAPALHATQGLERKRTLLQVKLGVGGEGPKEGRGAVTREGGRRSGDRTLRARARARARWGGGVRRNGYIYMLL